MHSCMIRWGGGGTIVVLRSIKIYCHFVWVILWGSNSWCFQKQAELKGCIGQRVFSGGRELVQPYFRILERDYFDPKLTDFAKLKRSAIRVVCGQIKFVLAQCCLTNRPPLRCLFPLLILASFKSESNCATLGCKIVKEITQSLGENMKNLCGV